MQLQHFIKSFIQLKQLFIYLVGTLKNSLLWVIFVLFFIAKGRTALSELFGRLGLHC